MSQTNVQGMRERSVKSEDDHSPPRKKTMVVDVGVREEPAEEMWEKGWHLTEWGEQSRIPLTA